MLRAGAEAEVARAQSSEFAPSPGPSSSTELPASSVMAFLRANEGALFCAQQEGDKAARRAMLRLEEQGRRKRKEEEDDLQKENVDG